MVHWGQVMLGVYLGKKEQGGKDIILLISRLKHNLCMSKNSHTCYSK